MLYNRGVYNSMLIAEAIAEAQKITGKKVVTGEDVRRGLENLNIDDARLKAIGLAGFVGPVKTSCADHNSHSATFVQQWDGAKWVKVSDAIAPDSAKVHAAARRSRQGLRREERRLARAHRAVRQQVTPRALAPPPSPASGRGSARSAACLREKRSEAPDGRESAGNQSMTDPPSATSPDRILDVLNIEVIYNSVALVLKGVSLSVPKGGIVALLGANGAGKTTTLKAISNLLRAERGEVTKGAILFEGERVDRLSPNDLVRRGAIQVMEGRHCFGHLTIEENLLTGAFTRRDGRAAVMRDLERVYAYFPRLKERRSAQAGYASGGEQQMCAIGRAMMSRPKLILLDEPSMGLAPQVVEEIFAIVRFLNEQEGVSFLLAEQNANIALQVAHFGYILETGRVVLDGAAEALRGNEDVREFYLGVGGADRRSFKTVKTYRRRKRWLA